MKKKIMSIAIAAIALASVGATAQTTAVNKAKNATENVIDKTGQEIKKDSRDAKANVETGMKKVRKEGKQLQITASKEVKRAERKLDAKERRVCKDARATRCAARAECRSNCDSLDKRQCDNTPPCHHKPITKDFRRHHPTAKVSSPTATEQKSATQK